MRPRKMQVNRARVYRMTRHSAAALVLLAAVAAPTPIEAQAQPQAPAQTQPQPPPTGAWGADVRPQVPTLPLPGPTLKGTQTESGVPANTTVVPRPSTSIEIRTAGQVTFQALISDEASPIEQGLLWRIYRDKPGTDGKMRLLSQHRDAAPQLRLDVGDYFVHVAHGRANVARRITVAAGKAVTEKFVINAGGLRVAALVSTGEPAPDHTVAYSVLSDERDQFGNRIPVVSGVRPGVLLRLNAGLYHLQSVYGDANAIARGEVAVEPGKITEATLTHAVARATFRLVTRAGGEALADTQWTIVGTQGEVVKESAGAFPSHHLAPGSYAVVARRLGQSFRRDFVLQPGDVVSVEVIAQTQP